MSPKLQEVFEAWLDADDQGAIGGDGRFGRRDRLIVIAMIQQGLKPDVGAFVEAFQDRYRQFKLSQRKPTTIPPRA